MWLVFVQDRILGIQALELRDEVLHPRHDLHGIVLVAAVDEGVDVVADVLVVVLADLGDHNLVMRGRLRIFLRSKKFLVQFLAVAQTREDDLNVRAAGELDHPLRQVHDLDRLAHVEDIDLAALAHAGGLQHQLAGLGDGHEVADDLRVGDGHRAAGLDLPAEQRNHGAVGAQDVAEARGNELGRRQAFLLDLAGERLHIDLADTLRAAHHVGGVHGLVGGDHHEALDLVFDGQVGQDFRAHDIVLDGLGDIVLHHRHVLVGRRMEDVLGAVSLEDVLHPGLVGDVGDDGGGVDFGPFLLDLEADVVQRGFGRIDQNQLVGVEQRHLTHDFTADGAGGAGDEDALPFQVRGDLLHVDMDGVATQEVLDLDFLDGALRQSTRQIVREFRRQEDLDAALQEAVGQVGVLQHFRLGRRDDHRLHVVPVQLVNEVLVVADDLHAHHHLSDDGRIVGHEAHEPETVVLLRADGLGDVDTGDRAVYIGVQLALRTPVQVEVVVQHLDEHPGDGQEHERHDIADEQDRDARQMIAEYGRPEHRHNQRASVSQCQRDEQVHHIDKRRQPEDVRIGAEHPEKHQRKGNDDKQCPDHLPLHQRHIREQEPGQIGDKYRKDND